MLLSSSRPHTCEQLQRVQRPLQMTVADEVVFSRVRRRRRCGGMGASELTKHASIINYIKKFYDDDDDDDEEKEEK